MSNSGPSLGLGPTALVLLGLAGCAELGGSAPSRVAPPAGGIAVHAAFVPARDDQVIEVNAEDRLAITEATLVMPDGSKTAAETIDTVANPSESSDRLANPSSADLAGGFDRPFAGAMTETTTLVGEIQSSAHIRVDQPADYAASWQSARIELVFGRGDGTVKQVIPAPHPPL